MSTIEQVICDLKEGKPIVLSDDENRENEGDLIFPSEIVTPEILSFMMNECRGLICMTITEEKRRSLGLPLQVVHNESVFGTNFALPFDHIDVKDIGVTAKGRAYTIKKIADQDATQSDLSIPGFVIPVVARAGGVLNRRGQTEGSIDLVSLAGYSESAIICEILNQQGEVVRGRELQDFCERHNLSSCTIEQLVTYRKRSEVSLRLIKDIPFSQDFPLRERIVSKSHNINGHVKIYLDDVDNVEHFALIFGDLENALLKGESLHVRIHSECLTGDVFGSLRCDCGPQLDESLRIITEQETGVLIYLMQEGRGIGLANKIKAYQLQEEGLDTFEANEKLGFEADLRDYRVATQILAHLRIEKVKLLTNNPLKIKHLEENGISVIERIPVITPHCSENEAYIRAKVDKMGHLIDL